MKFNMRYSLIFLFLITNCVNGQTLNEYTVSKIESTIIVDGKLDEHVWKNAALTEKFVQYETGELLSLSTRAKMLWDDSYLYVGFICEDPDVWATMTNRDDELWNGEVVEVFIDPDGDGLNYIELQVNPLNTILDLLVSKPWWNGGSGDFNWNLEDIHNAVWVYGTLNDSSDTDSAWTCEIAIPFSEIKFIAPSVSIPPQDGDTLRILVTRYDYERRDDETVEITAWNHIGDKGFHMPNRFGYAIFSDTFTSTNVHDIMRINTPKEFELFQNYPNPFNPRTTIKYTIPETKNPLFGVGVLVSLKVYDILGRKVATLINKKQQTGSYQVIFNSMSLSSGIYLYRLTANSFVQTKTMLLIK